MPAVQRNAPPRCERCGDLEFVLIPDPALPRSAWTPAVCPDCATWRRAERIQAMCGLNNEERKVTLADVIHSGHDTGVMVSAAQSFIREPVGMLTIHGGVGNGKTLALQSIVNGCLLNDVMAIYTTGYDLVNHVREAFSLDSNSARLRVKEFCAVTVLAIDEVDKVRFTDWVIELQSAIFDRRYRDGLARKCGTVLAMNKPPHECFGEWDWIISRLSDGRNTIVENHDPDMRRLMR